MSSETPKGPAEDRPVEPFTLGRIQWSRPPQTVFRAGPLPRVEGVARPAPRPMRNPGAGILTGSMVPQGRPVAPVEAEPVVESEIVAAAQPVEPEPVVEVVAPEPEAVVAQPAPEPEPVAPEPEPIAAAPLAQEIVIEPEAAEPAVTVPPPLSTDAKPAAKPRSLPSVVVTPAMYASVGAAMQKVAKGDRWPIVAGVAALIVIGGFIWLATLPAPQPIAPAPTPLVAGAPVIEDAPPVEEALPVVEAPVRARSVAPVAAAAAPVVIQPRRQAPVQAAPVVIAPPTEAAPRPYIETAPLVVEPPTPAAPAPTNPDAPVSTAPQPLN